MTGRLRGRGRGVCVAVLGVSLLALASTPAHGGTTFVVTVLTDGTAAGDCTLREAIKAANTDAAVDMCPAGSGADTITLGAGTYTLSIAGREEDADVTGDLDLTAPLTIQGAGATSTFVDAVNIDRVLDVIGTTVTISGLTITRGDAQATVVTSTAGGGIRNTGTLTVTDSVLTANKTDLFPAFAASGDGGAIFNSGTLTVLRSSITSNTTTGASSGGTGGGIANTGSATISDTVLNLNISASSGGAISNTGPLLATGLTITNNKAGRGGGLWTKAPAGTSVVVQGTLIANNNGVGNGGGVLDYGPLTIDQSTLSGNTAGNTTPPRTWGVGGGIYVEEPSPNVGTLTLTRSTLTNNTGSDGDAIFVFGFASIENSTISDNGTFVSGGRGGGLHVSALGTASLVNVTFGNNSAGFSGGGGDIWNAGSLTAKNTLAVYSDANCEGSAAITSLGHNLDFTLGSGTCFTGPTDLHVDPNLGLLADNGGPTKTRALPAGSPAVDAGDSSGCPASDQRGTIRPQGAGCDIGAYELLQPFALTVTVGGSGAGTVTSAPAGINCPTDCSETYAGGTVTLTPHPAAGSTFGGWSGACSGTGGCSVAMSAARSVGATFVAPPPPPPPPPPPGGTKPKCVVPQVVGKTLVKAKAAIKKRHCRTGKLARAYSKRVRKGHVLKQSPKAGKKLKNGAKVNLVLSRGRRP